MPTKHKKTPNAKIRTKISSLIIFTCLSLASSAADIIDFNQSPIQELSSGAKVFNGIKISPLSLKGVSPKNGVLTIDKDSSFFAYNGTNYFYIATPMPGRVELSAIDDSEIALRSIDLGVYFGGILYNNTLKTGSLSWGGEPYHFAYTQFRYNIYGIRSDGTTVHIKHVVLDNTENPDDQDGNDFETVAFDQPNAYQKIIIELTEGDSGIVIDNLNIEKIDGSADQIPNVYQITQLNKGWSLQSTPSYQLSFTSHLEDTPQRAEIKVPVTLESHQQGLLKFEQQINLSGPTNGQFTIEALHQTDGWQTLADFTETSHNIDWHYMVLNQFNFNDETWSRGGNIHLRFSSTTSAPGYTWKVQKIRVSD